MRGALIVGAFVLTLVALAGIVVQAGDRDQAGPGTWSVRILWLDLETRVGTIATAAALEYEVAESIEVGISSARQAEARAREVAAQGFTFDAGGRLQVVPAHRVERVEVYEIP